MADISIIIPLDGNKVQFKALCDSLELVTDEIAEFVIVRPTETEIDDEDLAGLPKEPVVIEHNGTLGEMWNAGIAASTCDYVYPASCRIRFSKAFYRVCNAQLTRVPLDMLVFHMQEFDLSQQEYTSKRFSMRLGLPAEPFQPSHFGSLLFQRLSTLASSAIFSKRFIEEHAFKFTAIASFDDDPGLPRLITKADSISNLPWPLVVLAYDSTTIFDEVDPEVFMKRYNLYANEYGEDLPLGSAFGSFVEWSVAFASRNFVHAPDALADQMLDAIGNIMLPIIGEHLEARDDALTLDGAETVLLSTFSRRDLIETICDLRTAGGEERYRSEMLQIMLNRAKAGAPVASRPRKRGLFRR